MFLVCACVLVHFSVSRIGDLVSYFWGGAWCGFGLGLLEGLGVGRIHVVGSSIFHQDIGGLADSP